MPGLASLEIGCNATKRLIASGAARQENELTGTCCRARAAYPNGQAQDRLNPGGLAGVVKGNGAIEPMGVGEGQMSQPILRRLAD